MSEPAPPVASAAPHSAWVPMRRPVFRMLWLTWLASNVGMWMNDVAAAWLMTSLTTSPIMVALVQSASSAPVFLLGVPSGALADILDRRRYYLATQCWVAFNAIVLFIVVFAGWLTAPLLLLLTFANGIGMAMRWPVYSAIVPDLVPRDELHAAIGLNGIAMNASRVIGPVAAGALLASLGGAWVFALNAVLAVGAAFVILRWRSEQQVSPLPAERFVGAMRVGVQYVMQSRPLRVALARVTIFFLQTTALLALLPLVAKQMPGGGAGTYTLLMASLGLGAIAVVFWLPQLRARFDRDRLMRDGSVLQAVAMVAVGFAPNAWLAAPAMFIAGAAWLAVVNTLTVSAQLVLPNWVRARGMSIYQVAIMGASAASAALWGQVATLADVSVSFVAAAATGLVALFATRHLHEGLGEPVDLTPGRYLDEPVPAFPIEHEQGPVMVTIEYRIDPVRAEEFAVVMRETRADRLRKGALSWGLFEDTTARGRYLEYFLDESWAEHLRRFERMTASDWELRARRNAFHVGPGDPRITRYLAHSIKR